MREYIHKATICCILVSHQGFYLTVHLSAGGRAAITIMPLFVDGNRDSAPGPARPHLL